LFWKTGKFVFSTSGEHINVSDGALNLVWCAGLASWYIYQAYTNAQKSRLPEVRLGTDQEAIDALDLYEWAIRCVRNGQYDPWPARAPCPTRMPKLASPNAVATELFLTAVAWMLLHETGHIALKHPLLETSRARVEENQADAFATHHVLDGVSEPDILFKRSLGIVVANVILVLLDLMSEQEHSPFYPTVEERLIRNLRENQLADPCRPIHAFATVLLQVHLHMFGVPYKLDEHPEFGSFVDDFCRDLHRSRQIKR
jgi:hypothetical protein